MGVNHMNCRSKVRLFGTHKDCTLACIEIIQLLDVYTGTFLYVPTVLLASTCITLHKNYPKTLCLEQNLGSQGVVKMISLKTSPFT